MLLKRYYDLLSEGVPREALAELDALKTVPRDSCVQLLSDVYTRGQELIVVLESPGPVTLELLFSRQKYYKVNEKIARGYMHQVLTSLKALHGCLIVHRNVNMSSFYLTAGG